MVKLSNIKIPKNTKAILWDMDGVLIDSLGLDLKVCNELLKNYFGKEVELSREYIKSIFAYSVPKFWNMILQKVAKDFNIAGATNKYRQILNDYKNLRQNYSFELNPGVAEILEQAKNKGLSQVVVSNNPTQEVKEILSNVGILNYFDFVIGNDIKVGQKQLAKKPAPDTYVFAAQKADVAPERCVAIEDSALGVESAKGAGCYTIGVATGGHTQTALKKRGADKVYKCLKSI